MPNRKNIQTLITVLEQRSDVPFDFAKTTKAEAPTPLNECGTPGCIAGFAAFIWPHVSTADGWNFEAAQDQLGLTDDDAQELFYATEYANEYDEESGEEVPTITRSMAIEALRVFAAPNYIDNTFFWSDI